MELRPDYVGSPWPVLPAGSGLLIRLSVGNPARPPISHGPERRGDGLLSGGIYLFRDKIPLPCRDELVVNYMCVNLPDADRARTHANRSDSRWLSSGCIAMSTIYFGKSCFCQPFVPSLSLACIIRESQLASFDRDASCQS